MRSVSAGRPGLGDLSEDEPGGFFMASRPVPEATGSSRATRSPGATATAEIRVGGMHCASCVANVEKSLQKVPGVVLAGVNLATERATVEYDPERVGTSALEEAVRGAGYEVIPLAEAGAEAEDEERAIRRREQGRLRRRFLLAAIMGAIVLLGNHAQWLPFLPSILGDPRLLFVLTLPVQFWAGWQFYSGAAHSLRRRTADMNTLIAVGTSAAFLYSTVATFLPSLFPEPLARTGHPPVYFDTSAVIIALILLGRLLEARARTRTGEAIRALIGLQPATARVERHRQEVASRQPRSAWETSSSSARARGFRSTERFSMGAPAWMSRC
jgi:Cu+-exporting ATPase